MDGEKPETGLPAQIADAISSVPKALIPNTLKALDRLIGASIDIPAAKLAQYKAKIDAQTAAYQTVEAAIGAGVATHAAADPEIIKGALEILVRKSYRKQENVEAVVQSAVDELRTHEPFTATYPETEAEPLDDDWLNVFERHAEDATSERMQNLFGRVLAGQICSPGRYSLRSLRFLSELSQDEALMFADISKYFFGDIAPISLIRPPSLKNIGHLITLEAAGLITGISGSGLTYTMEPNETGISAIREGTLIIRFQSVPGKVIVTNAACLTPLGRELIGLLPGRTPLEAARTVALAMKRPEIMEGLILHELDDGSARPIEVVWQSTPTESTAS